MIWWVLGLAVLTILSYLSDVDIFTFMHTLRIPLLKSSLLTILILLCTAGIFGRMRLKARAGEKEALEDRINDLEKRLKVSPGREE